MGGGLKTTPLYGIIMNIPFLIKCSECQKESYIFISLDDRQLSALCECGNDISGFLDNSFTTGVKLLFRSKYEYLEKKDYSLSIVFSAAALEGEISQLFFKWKDIENIRKPIRISDEELEETLRNYKTIDRKIENVAKLMYPGGIVEFVNSNKDLHNMIQDGFSSISVSNISNDIRKELFWKRNRILHLADVKYKEEEAKKCFNIARLGLKVFEELDNYKRNTI
ncbi:MAG: hypothetical protein RDU14_02575 [Melioribacteraceae bacterium]|nr:hypothetical protein [Melioribacteraceae bacterium]